MQTRKNFVINPASNVIQQIVFFVYNLKKNKNKQNKKIKELIFFVTEESVQQYADVLIKKLEKNLLQKLLIWEQMELVMFHVIKCWKQHDKKFKF